MSKFYPHILTELRLTMLDFTDQPYLNKVISLYFTSTYSVFREHVFPSESGAIDESGEILCGLSKPRKLGELQFLH